MKARTALLAATLALASVALLGMTATAIISNYDYDLGQYTAASVRAVLDEYSCDAVTYHAALNNAGVDAYMYYQFQGDEYTSPLLVKPLTGLAASDSISGPSCLVRAITYTTIGSPTGPTDAYAVTYVSP